MKNWIKKVCLTLIGIIIVGEVIIAQDLSSLEYDKQMIRISKGLYASKFEVSNADWKRFLAEKQAKGESIQGLEYTKEPWLAFPFAETDPIIGKYYTDSRYKSFPIVNISHEAARKYCVWLTEKYNGLGTKKKHQNVKFRLPTEDEWKKAAGTKGKELSFSTRSIKNDRQQYYMNGKFQDEILAEGGDQYASDGAFYTTNVNNTRFNNEGLFGLTHIFGNAAEMIDIEGVAKGGHWANYPDECGISKSYNYTGPDCRVSFRIFMEVEEKEEPKAK